ncbi:MAG TPA: phage major capsid protein [Candidatus Sumerlaeota bacterium]|nr:phage major capsid protein [Candidatus Sumerlaeota bacterium]
MDRLQLKTATGAGRVERNGGVYGAGRITGVSVITRGEARGHALWIDDVFLAQVATAGREAKHIKARFDHPSFLGDVLGTVVGVFRDFRKDGNRVRADLHLLATAKDAPHGNLGDYVMSLAAEAPDLFGASIEFSPHQAMQRQFVEAHTVAGRFRSPDADNTNNFIHAQLDRLFACDLVDEPAANPAGAFAATTGGGATQFQSNRGAKMLTELHAERRIDVAIGRQLQQLVAAARKSPSGVIELTAGSDEHGGYSDPYGGFLVPAGPLLDLRPSAFSRAGEILSRCLAIETNAPEGAPSWPIIDETQRGDGYRWGGVSAKWTAETQTPGLSRFAVAVGSLRFNTLAVLVAVSNEVLEAPGAFGTMVRRVLAAEASYKLEQSIMAGTGAGQPAGVIGSPATIEVAAEDGQTTASALVWENVAKMRARLAPECVAGATWIVNHELLEFIADLDAPAGALDFSGPRPRILGLPVLESEAAAAVGERGDIVLADFSQYVVAHRPEAFAISAHVRFEHHESVIRFTLRVDGSPLWKSPVKLANGSTTVSPFVTLAARPGEGE